MQRYQFTRYPWNLNLIRNVDDNIVLWTRKVFNSDSFSMASCKQKMHESLFKRNQKLIYNSLNKQKHEDLIHACLDKAFKGIVGNQTLPFYVWCVVFSLSQSINQSYNLHPNNQLENGERIITFPCKE